MQMTLSLTYVINQSSLIFVLEEISYLIQTTDKNHSDCYQQ